MNYAAISTAITIFATIVGVVLGVIGALNYSKKETKQETGNSTRVEIKLDYAITGINEIKSDIKDTKKDVGNLADRVTRVEESSKSAHKRIDLIEEKENK